MVGEKAKTRLEIDMKSIFKTAWQINKDFWDFTANNIENIARIAYPAIIVLLCFHWGAQSFAVLGKNFDSTIATILGALLTLFNDFFLIPYTVAMLAISYFKYIFKGQRQFIYSFSPKSNAIHFFCGTMAINILALLPTIFTSTFAVASPEAFSNVMRSIGISYLLIIFIYFSFLIYYSFKINFWFIGKAIDKRITVSQSYRHTYGYFWITFLTHSMILVPATIFIVLIAFLPGELGLTKEHWLRGYINLALITCASVFFCLVSTYVQSVIYQKAQKRAQELKKSPSPQIS
jgi:hypothetical protein